MSDGFNDGFSREESQEEMGTNWLSIAEQETDEEYMRQMQEVVLEIELAEYLEWIEEQ